MAASMPRSLSEPSTPTCTVTFAPFMLGGDPQQQVRAGMDGRLAQLELGLDGPAGALVRVAIRSGSVLAPGPIVWEDVYVKPAAGEEDPVFDVSSADLLLLAGETFVIEFGRDPSAPISTLATLFGNVSFPTEPPRYPEPFFVNGQPLCAQHPFAICTTRAAFRTFRDAGFENISLDLIFAVPGQTLEEWEADLREALALQPDHLSCYNLTFEAGTRLTRDMEQGKVRL